MPTVLVPIDNSDVTISRLIVKSVIEQLMFMTEMTAEDIIYIERGGKSTSAQIYKDHETLKLDAGNYIKVEYKEVYDPNNVDISRYQPEYLPIFNAPKLGLVITPLHSKTTIEMTITYKSRSYNTISNWLSGFRHMLELSSPSHVHDVMYNYTIPYDVLTYLYHAYVHIEAIAPYGVDLGSWVKDHFTDGLMVRHSLNNKNKDLAINVHSTNNIGIYTQLPENIETTLEPPETKITFTYNFTYDKVIELLVEYQKYIHNQTCNYNSLKRYADRRYHKRTSLGHRTFTGSVNVVGESPDIDMSKMFFDYEDMWHPKSVPVSTSTILMVPIQLDLPDLVTVLNLHEINLPTILPARLLEIISRYSNCAVSSYKFPIQIYLYEVNDVIGMVPLNMDNTLNITSKLDLDPRNRYYLRIAIVTDWTLLDLTCNDFRNDADAMLYLYGLLNPNYTIKTLGDGRFVSDIELDKALNDLNNTNFNYRVYYGIHRYFTVATTSIIAKR